MEMHPDGDALLTATAAFTAITACATHDWGCPNGLP